MTATLQVQHVIVVCVAKQQRGLVLKEILERAGYRVLVALSLYDSLNLIAQEMPHVVVAESHLPDGTAITLFDRLQSHKTLQKTPILVHVMTKLRSEIQQLAQKKFSGFLIGEIDPKTVLTKVLEVVHHFGQVSPYYFELSRTKVEGKATLYFNGSILGLSHNQIVCQTGTEIDSSTDLLCVPKNRDPVILRGCQNMVHEDMLFNLFPIERAVGQGRKWLTELAAMSLSGEEDAGYSRTLLYFDPNREQIKKFEAVFQSYDIRALTADSMAKTCTILKTYTDEVRAIYLSELLNDSYATEFKSILASIPANRRPTLIVGTSALNPTQTHEMRYIKKPFGIGELLRVIEAAFESFQSLNQSIKKQAVTEVPVQLKMPSQLLGLDECGGCLQTRFKLSHNTVFQIDHPLLTEVFHGEQKLTVVGSQTDPTGHQTIRFNSLSAGLSKTKYWEKILKIIES